MANKRPETGTLNITVRGGVNVEDQRYSNTKGDYFKGFMAGDKTVLVSDGARRYWTIVMDDMQTGERHTFTFSYEMLIGRTPPQNSGEVKLVLARDGSVSGNQNEALGHDLSQPGSHLRIGGSDYRADIAV